MALSVGSVTVADDGTRTGSGFAVALYDEFLSGLRAPTTPKEEELQLSSKRACAGQCVAMARAIINYLVANAELSGNAQVTTQVLGKTPNPLAADTAIQPPASPVDIPLTGTIR